MWTMFEPPPLVPSIFLLSLVIFQGAFHGIVVRHLLDTYGWFLESLGKSMEESAGKR